MLTPKQHAASLRWNTTLVVCRNQRCALQRDTASAFGRGARIEARAHARGPGPHVPKAIAATRPGRVKAAAIILHGKTIALVGKRY